ncbi:ATP-binding protein [Acinetobacter sp.]|uniref:ATP-binding protein n=1 Tax=Acinetobacter sp. TaxID=472 RepID=UPI0038903FF1
MYAGSTSLNESTEYLYDLESKKMVLYQINVIPAFIKIVSEILDNAIDESRRAPDVLDSIRVEINEADGSISVTDNGRGIPVEVHPQTGKYIAETVFSNLRAGSNFNDDEDQQLIGTNGVGSTLTNVLSTSFKIESADGKKLFRQEFTNGMRERSEPKVRDHDKHYTKITFTPDYAFFKLDGMDEDHKLKIIKKVVDAAATNTKVKFYVNGERILIRDFSDYIALYADEYVYDENKDFKVGVSKSEGFEQISFVNSVETYQGGTHVTYCINQIVDALRERIKKKHKVEVSPSDIRNHVRIYISANVNRPRFSSQTKENMLSPPSEWKTSWQVPDKFIRKLMDSEIIVSVLDWVKAKEQADLMKDLRKANKEVGKADPRKVDKFSDAMERHDRQKCILFLAEGDSASKSIQGGRGKNPYIASFPMKGKPLNVREKEISRVLGLDKKKEKEAAGKKVEPNEIQKILTIIGLQIGVPVTDLSQLRFGKLAVASDADVDGFHICGLIMNLIDHFWPELFKMGFIHILRTPVIVVTLKDKSEIEFFTERDFKDWEAGDGVKLKGWSKNYYKGLSKWKTPQFAKFLDNPDQYLFKVTMEDEDDKDAIDLAFNGQRADDRKEWLETPADDFEQFIVRA